MIITFNVHNIFFNILGFNYYILLPIKILLVISYEKNRRFTKESKATSIKYKILYSLLPKRVYVAKKHYGFFHRAIIFFTYAILVPLNLLGHGYKDKAKYAFKGGINGLKGNMEMNEYTVF